eukprot:TRINITY_DN1037_c0_g1_i1.p1 TRINITY_DN1037_c0_g1~~TRINITY_DN1037_c0_g1_i1.p1  ORF type:complete len:486 (+),score=124.12 TRINITY_DN1037_c0_g1_i1:62-1459(+)
MVEMSRDRRVCLEKCAPRCTAPLSFFNKTLFVFVAFVLLCAVDFVHGAGLTENVISGCAASYDPNMDYFPDKVQVQYASNFQVQYFNNYKVITNTQLWQGGTVTFQNILYQCGTPPPQGFDGAQFVSVPVRRTAPLSTTYMGFIESLGAPSSIVAVENFADVTSGCLQSLIQAGKIAEVGYDINMTTLAGTYPNVIWTSTYDGDTEPAAFKAAGLRYSFVSEYLEPNPLARAEWLEFFAMFYNREKQAQAATEAIASRYHGLKSLVAGLGLPRPSVIWANPAWDAPGMWEVPGGQSLPAGLITDAGGAYTFASDPSTSSVYVNFTALSAVSYADVWFTDVWATPADAVKQQPLIASFASYKNNRIFNSDKLSTSDGATDYNEGAVSQADLLLADMVRVLYPNISDGYGTARRWFRNIATENVTLVGPTACPVNPAPPPTASSAVLHGWPMWTALAAAMFLFGMNV